MTNPLKELYGALKFKKSAKRTVKEIRKLFKSKYE